MNIIIANIQFSSIKICVYWEFITIEWSWRASRFLHPIRCTLSVMEYVWYYIIFCRLGELGSLTKIRHSYECIRADTWYFFANANHHAHIYRIKKNDWAKLCHYLSATAHNKYYSDNIYVFRGDWSWQTWCQTPRISDDFMIMHIPTIDYWGKSRTKEKKSESHNTIGRKKFQMAH